MAEPLRYPVKKLEKSDDYLQIDIIEYKAPGLSTQPGSFALNSSDQTYASNATILQTIFLPIPESIGDSNSAGWGASTMGPLEAAAASVTSGIIKDPSIENIKKQGSDKLESAIKALETGTGQNAIRMGIAGGILRALSGGKLQGEKYLERGAGITFNQNVELLFSGVSLREGFNFSFDMVARSRKESEHIKKIIRSFKKYSAVRKGLDFGEAEGLFLKAPQVFKIRYMSGGKPHPFLNKFKICALLSMGVNYASGSYATYVDGTPVNLQLTLNFQELTPIYYEDYLTTGEGGSDDGIGVGY